jgi:hypothetical protein
MVAFREGCHLEWISPVVPGEFEQMIPGIRQHSQLLFSGIEPSELESLVDEVIANALDIFLRLAERGLVDLAYPKPLVLAALAMLRRGSLDC